MTLQAQWWFVSDLHLALNAVQPRRTSEAFATFVDTVVLTHQSPDRHLVMLGDTFDLAGPDAAADLIALAERHSTVFDAWRSCLRQGVAVHFVCGNHDLDLITEPVLDVVHDLLPGDELTVHPWVLRADGLFFAEHGQQHHAPHRVPTILLAARTAESRPAPAPLAAWTAQPDAALGRRLAALLTAARASRRAEGQIRSDQYRALVEAEAERIGLSTAALQAVASTSPFGVRSVLGVVGRMLLRHLRLDAPGAYLQSAAAHVHTVLADHQCAARWYIFGHSHRATESCLAGPAVRYLNAGTWSADVRGAGPDTVDPTLFPLVRVDVRRRGASASLYYWRFNAPDPDGPESVAPAARARPPTRRLVGGNAH